MYSNKLKWKLSKSQEKKHKMSMCDLHVDLSGAIEENSPSKGAPMDKEQMDTQT